MWQTRKIKIFSSVFKNIYWLKKYICGRLSGSTGRTTSTTTCRARRWSGCWPRSRTPWPSWWTWSPPSWSRTPRSATRECAGRGRGCFGGCHGASTNENQGGSENPDRDIVTRGKYSDMGKGGVRQMTDPLIVGISVGSEHWVSRYNCAALHCHPHPSPSLDILNRQSFCPASVAQHLNMCRGWYANCMLAHWTW